MDNPSGKRSERLIRVFSVGEEGLNEVKKGHPFRPFQRGKSAFNHSIAQLPDFFRIEGNLKGCFCKLGKLRSKGLWHSVHSALIQV